MACLSESRNETLIDDGRGGGIVFTPQACALSAQGTWIPISWAMFNLFMALFGVLSIYHCSIQSLPLSRVNLKWLQLRTEPAGDGMVHHRSSEL